MTGKAWLIMLGVGLAVSGSGCMTCCHQSAKVLVDVGPTCEIPALDRQHVYVFLVNGLTPPVSYGLEGLRDDLAARGFAKAYYGQLCHFGWMRNEMGRVHADDPSARFVVVGYDFGAAPAARLAAAGVADGLPVDAVVLLDPVGKQPMSGCPVRTILVGCGAAAVATPHTERVVVPDANHFTLPAHPQTVEVVYGLLKETAARVVHPPIYELLPGPYEHAPLQHPVTPPGPGFPAEWLFLEDVPGPHAVPLTPVPDGLMPVPVPPALLPRSGTFPNLRPQLQEVVPVVPVPVPLPVPGQPRQLPAPRKLESNL